MTITERLAATIYWLKTERIILSQAEFADKIEIKASQISEMINGKRPVSERTIHKIAAVFTDLSEEWLLTGEGDMLNCPEVSSVTNSSMGETITTLKKLMNDVQKG